ncbi:hypothetical protein PQX77_015315 [Marasmius sp. AFHP31]|nr:hypothetical protein PQX77_015315 [Marasmius sp. AFHP31]
MEVLASSALGQECLISEWKDIPPPEGTTSSRTLGTGDNARTETTTTPPSEKEVADWEEKHLLWKRANSQLKAFMQLTLTHDLYIPLKDMTATGAWTFMKKKWGKPMLSTIYGDFLKATTFTINQNNPLSSIARLSLILVQAIPKVWEAAASKCLHDYLHELDDDDASSNNEKNIRVPRPPGSKPGLTLNRVQDTIMVEYEWLNPQFTGRLTRQQQRGQQQQQNNQQQCTPPSTQDKVKKKKQQQQGMCGGIDRDAGNSVGNCGGNRPHGHSHFTSVASTITPPFSSVTKRKDQVALNAIEQSLRAEIATEPDNLWAGYHPPSTWDETYPDLNFKAASHLPSSHARGSPPPVTFKGFWDKSCNSTLAPPPPAKKENPANMQKFSGFKPLDVPKTARIDPIEGDDVGMDDGNDLTSLFSDDVDNNIAEAAGVEENVLDNVSLGSFYDNPDALD